MQINKIIQCQKCVLDTSVPDIIFDKKGICNYCHAYDKIIATIPIGDKAKLKLDSITKKIKNNGKNKEYDCLIGLSGGIDSTYLTHMIIELGLRPLVVHIDTGWNSEIAVKNIENIITKLNLDLFTYVVDWKEMQDLQLAFFKASVPDCDIPQDHVFPALLHKIAKQHNIKDIISGHNLVTEFISPQGWVYDSNDLPHLLDIHNKFGKNKLKKYPTISTFDRLVYYRYINPIKSHRLLYYIPYNKEEIKKFITDNLDWKDYGGKHFESKFTKFFQAYYLPEKFGFDKRKAHLSNLVISNQITKEEALKKLEKPLYDSKMLTEDIDFIIKKLGIDKDEWNEIMKLPLKNHSDYKTEKNIILYKFSVFVKGILK
jgi:N-acetyl sugar amidotransferase